MITLRSEEQAIARYDRIKKMVENYEDATTNTQREKMLRLIRRSPVELHVRSGWHHLGEAYEPKNYLISLCVGGPSVRIRGDIDYTGTPRTASLEHQDMGLSCHEGAYWRKYWRPGMSEVLLKFAQCFNFGG